MADGTDEGVHGHERSGRVGDDKICDGVQAELLPKTLCQPPRSNMMSTLKVSCNRTMAEGDPQVCPGDWTLHSSLPHMPHSFGRAALSGNVQDEVHEQQAAMPERAPALVLLCELRLRSKIMFSGDSGATVGSGRKGATMVVSHELIANVISVINELPPELFDKNATHRPCGLLDKRGAGSAGHPPLP